MVISLSGRRRPPMWAREFPSSGCKVSLLRPSRASADAGDPSAPGGQVVGHPLEVLWSLVDWGVLEASSADP